MAWDEVRHRHRACSSKAGSPPSMVTERRRGPASDAFISVRLIHKYANTVDGVDLSHVNVGDHVRLRSRDATLLIAEGWAVPYRDCVNAERRRPSTAHHARAAPTRAAPDQNRRPAPITTSPRHNAQLAHFQWYGHNGPLFRALQLPAEQTKV
jgi:hypothetical protein